ncbi:hypothetical protein H6G20_11985 [Desertifilum sp. FACHB-1129]|uniref:hypothetical protein n=1 Tax=unclassified Desertifilum TaxID=2621682 RepID=UPI001684F329|nr:MULTISPECIES: hypothetical protein [unclassified Desertifilum]MBD2312381.1 hypothetical protein [Desertifilum sp. FACHB-1129]MBD2321164.1 hypothetical protein [Desertifilum sp. FACHB-866]MBD2331529.1 hypothetical protein [Desertifilum sp. FACHB-868]
MHWLEQFAQHPEAGIRRAIARNPNTPLDTLKSLERDRDPYICKAAQVKLKERFPELA